MRTRLRGDRYLVTGAAAFVSGCAWVALASLEWYYTQHYALGQQAAIGAVTQFFLYEAVAICLTAAGAWSMLRGLARRTEDAPDSLRSVLSEALSSRRNVKIGAVAGLLYGIAYLFVSSILVFQPTVDFQSAYGAAGAGVNAAVCCGPPGTVPELIVYLSPQLHLGLQVLPLDALFAVVVPVLVGFNVAVAAHALGNSLLRSRAGWLGPVGIVAGLFTGCPTCAGLFLAGTLGGLGATSLAVALAPYQALFVVLSIPVLVASPMVTALYAGRAARAACAVPGQASPAVAREMLKKS